MVSDFTLFRTHFRSPLGFLEAYANIHGITSLSFTEKTEAEITENPVINNHLELLRSQLDEYFSGRRRVFTVPLAPTGTPFQKQVWDKLLEIPFGESRSYKEQADRFGNAAAIRAIASANGKNPIAILIPCHRILGHDGSLTGYAGGLHRKQWLLDHERKYSGQAIQGRLFD